MRTKDEAMRCSGGLKIQELRSGLHRYLGALIQEGVIPGFGLKVSYRDVGEFSAFEGYCDLDAFLPMTPNVRFAVYSITKPVTALALLRLVANGEISLNAPVSDYLPGWLDPMADGDGRIRVRHLLSQTAGLTYGSRNSSVVEAYRAAGFLRSAPVGVTGPALYHRFSSLPRLFPPGEEWTYSLAYDVLGWIASEVRGVALAQVLREEVFIPLGMRQSCLLGDLDDTSNLALVYRMRSGIGWVREESVMCNWARGAVPSGGGGLVTTVGDLQRLAEAFISQPSNFLSERLWRRCLINCVPRGRDLSAAKFSSFPGRAVRGVGYGFGVAIVTDGSRVGFPGSTGEVSWEGSTGCLFLANPDTGLALSFLTNVYPASGTSLWFGVRSLVYGLQC